MRLGLRGQILVALLLVTLGGIVSVGAIAMWRTRLTLAAERVERVGELSLLAVRAASLSLAAHASLALSNAVDRNAVDRNAVERNAVDRNAVDRNAVDRGVLERIAGEVSRAVGADEVAFLGERGELLAPARATALPGDDAGRTAALAGMPPHARSQDGDAILYARLQGGAGAPLVMRATFAVDRWIDRALEDTRHVVLLLGVLNGLVLVAAAAWLLRSVVVAPVLALERAAARVADGDLDARVATRGTGELGRLADAFDRMTSSLREGRESLIRTEKLAGVGRLAAGVAHEVGNPLAAILGYAEILLSDSADRPLAPAVRRESLERVRTETERIQRIISELLEYARPPAETPEPVDLRATLVAALALVRVQARFHGVEARLEFAPELPPVRATTGRLTQLLLNLLLNAADAMEGTGAIVVDGRRDGGRVILGVTDDGPGVPVEHRARIFDPFFTTKEPGRGTGLGLAVCAAIAESYGGTVRLVAREAGLRGARFELTLPVA